MPLYPGNDTVHFSSEVVPVDRLHRAAAPSVTTFAQIGCAMQPATVNDKVSDTQYSEATDRCIVPANANTELIKAEWIATFTPTGTTSLNYRVLGVKPYRDNWGRIDHITLVCKEENG